VTALRGGKGGDARVTHAVGSSRRSPPPGRHRPSRVHVPVARVRISSLSLWRVLLHLWTRASHGAGVQTAAVSLSEPGFCTLKT
jgi:hypothetical protein